MQPHSLLSNASLVINFFLNSNFTHFLKEKTKKQGTADKGVCGAAPWTHCAGLCVLLVLGPDTPLLRWPGFAWRSQHFAAGVRHRRTGTVTLHFAAEAK